MELVKGSQLGPYEIVERLATSPMAGIYRAHQASLDRDVTLTLLAPALLAREGVADRIRSAARAAAQLHHPHIVPLYDLHCEGELCYLVTEHVAGTTLAARLEEVRARGERLPSAEVLKLAQAVGAALAYAHGRGTVHGQVQPANVILGPDGEPALTGFGLASLAEGLSFTDWLSVPISPAYLSPEQCRGQAAASTSDVYALGVTLYEMVAGGPPFVAVSPLDLAIKQASEPAPALAERAPELPPAAGQVILRALAKDPAERYASANELVAALSAVLAGESAAAKPAPAEAPAEPPAKAELPETPLAASIGALLAAVRGGGAKKEGGNRGWWAQLLALLGAGLALVQYLVQVFDLINRPLAPIVSALPYVIILFLAGAAVASVLVLLRPAPRLQKRIAAIALGLIAVVSLSWGGWTYYNATRPPKAVIVLVAEFDGQKAARGVDWGRRIYLQVKDEVGKLDLDGQVEVQRVFETYEDSAAARTAGDARKATLVLWGWYDDLGVSPHFEVLRSASHSARLLDVPLAQIVDFDLYARTGSQEMAYITGVVLGLVHYSEGDYAGAIPLFTAALAAAPAETAVKGQEVAYVYRAAARLDSGAPAEDAVADFQQAIARKPDLYEAHWGLAIAYAYSCSPAPALDAALREAQTAVQLRPNSGQAHWVLGETFTMREEWTKAAAAYRAALDLDANYAAAYTGLARAQEMLGQTAEAKATREQGLAVCQKALVGQPKDPAAAQDALGTAAWHLERYDEAIAAYKEALRLAPNNGDYHRHLAGAYYWKSKTADSSSLLNDAIGAYQAAIRLSPTDALAHTNLALAYLDARRPDEALKEYQAAVRVAPCDAEALYLLASQYSQRGQDAEAEAAFQRLTQLKPSLAIAWEYLASAAFGRGDYAGAEANYRTAVRLQPDDAGLHFGLGSALYGLQRYADAEAEFRRATELEPTDAVALASWGDALAKLGRSAEAIAAYQKALALDAQQPVIWVSLGLVYEAGRDPAHAEAAYAEAAKLAAGDAMVHAAHARVLWQLNRLDEAIAEYEAAARLAPTEPAYPESLALLYAGSHQPDKAIAAAQATIDLNPQSALAHLVLGGIAEDRSDKAKARSEYELALRYAGQNAAVKQAAEQGLARVGQ